MNLLLDTREYEVEFPDGSIDVLTANAIAKSLYSQVDEEGRSYLILSEIVDHRKDRNAISCDNAKIPGTNRLQWTRKGWQLLVEWKNRSSDWILLVDLKNSYQYAVNNKIALEPAFAWWVPHALKKRDQIIQKVETHFRKKQTHKFGIKVPCQSKKLWTLTRERGLICGARQLRKKCAMWWWLLMSGMMSVNSKASYL
jgi:hypothetical protein